jgi:hypothetical protein
MSDTLECRAMFVFKKVIFEILLIKFFYVYFSLEKLVNKKYFSVKEKFSLISRKVFS